MQNITLLCRLGSIVLLALVIWLGIVIQKRRQYRKAYKNFLDAKVFQNPRTFKAYVIQYARIKSYYTAACACWVDNTTWLQKIICVWYHDLAQDLYEGLFIQMYAIKTFAYIPKKPVNSKIPIPDSHDDIEMERCFGYQWDEVYKEGLLRDSIDSDTIKVIAGYAVGLCEQQLRSSCKNDSIYQFNDILFFVWNWASRNQQVSCSAYTVYASVSLCTHRFVEDRQRFIKNKIINEFDAITSNKKFDTANKKAEAIKVLLNLRFFTLDMFAAEKAHIRKQYDRCLSQMYQTEDSAEEKLKLFEQIQTVEIKNELLQSAILK